MVPINQVDSFIQSVTEKYYAKDQNIYARVAESLFGTQPGVGAASFID